MLRPRIIPVLLYQDDGLVKTVKFKNSKYVGDPLNAVKIYNEKKADELIFLDIDATVKNLSPNYKLIEKIANQSRMPICYGGGIKTAEQAKRIFSLGIEKIALSSIGISNPAIITKIASEVGNQSVVIVLDIKKSLLGKYELYTHNATTKSKVDIEKYVKSLRELGAGEIVVNNIDRDGTLKGYDLDLITYISSLTDLPITSVGGVGKIEHFQSLLQHCDITGLGAGSLFVFKGRYKAVLINYPDFTLKKRICQL